MATCVVTLALPDGTGAPRMACFFCRALTDAGHRVILVCGDVPPAAHDAGNRMLDELRQAGVEIQILPELRMLARPKTVAKLQSIVVGERADCVICFQQRDQVAALWAAYRAGVPCIISAQNQYTFWGNWPTRKMKEAVFARSTRRLASLAICTSELVQRELVDRFGLAREKTTILPNGVDVRGFPEFSMQDNTRVRDTLGVKDGELLLVNVGRIDLQKGQDLLLEAFSRVEEINRLKLVLVGGVSRGGNEERMQLFFEELQRRVDESQLRDRVIFTGWRDDVSLLLSAADFYVHAARWEGWPLVLVEAMAAGRPVISTDCAGRPMGFQDDVHGRIVPSEDVDALRSAISNIVQLSADERNRMGAAARDLAETHYDIRAIGTRFVQLIEGAISSADKVACSVGAGT